MKKPAAERGEYEARCRRYRPRGKRRDKRRGHIRIGVSPKVATAECSRYRILYGSHLPKPPIMPLADIKNWISGETEVFFDPRQTSPAAASVDGNLGGERLTARASIRKFVHLAIAAVIGACASVALVYFVVLMRNSVEPSRATDAELQSSGSGTFVTGG